VQGGASAAQLEGKRRNHGVIPLPPHGRSKKLIARSLDIGVRALETH